MVDVQLMTQEIQADLLNVTIKIVKEASDIDGFVNIIQREIFSKHFDMEQMTVLTLDGDTLKSIQNSGQVSQQFKGLPYALVEPYFLHQSIVQIPYFLSQMELFKSYNLMMQILNENNQLLGIFLFKSTDKWDYFSRNNKALVQLLRSLAKISDGILTVIERYEDENQYRKLYNMTGLFHSSMDMDQILIHIIQTVSENFPGFGVELILSNDHQRQTLMNIKSLDYLSERPSTIEAFVSGEITSDFVAEQDVRLLNVPIKGSQAIYGILQVSTPARYIFSSKQREFIKMLADASGNALENGKLYHQSFRLISDLQMINETSHRLNMKLNINDMLNFLKRQLVKSFKPMAVVFALKENNKTKIMEASSVFFDSPQSNFYIEHVEAHFQNSTDPLFIADLSRVVELEEIPYKSLMAIPLLIEENLKGYSIVLHSDSYYFSFDSYKLMQSLIHHASLAISNLILKSRLQDMVDRDHLTNLYARSYLDSYVEKSLADDQSGMFLLIDIDNFKQVNDLYGHQKGDEILVQIANQLMLIVGERGICARWGGEELAVYIANHTEDELRTIANEVIDTIPKVTNPPVTISAGLINWHLEEPIAFKDLFLKADIALYEAKHNGKNQVIIYQESAHPIK